MLHLVNTFERKKNEEIKFYMTVVWREQKNHLTNCYFCMTKISGFSKKTRSQIKYPNCPSAIKRVPHSLHYSAPQPPSIVTFDSKYEDSTKSGTILVSESDFQAKEFATETGKVRYLIFCLQGSYKI